MPFVTNHSRCSAAVRSLQIAGPNEIATSLGSFSSGSLFADEERFAGRIASFRDFRGAAIPRRLLSALFKQLSDQPGPAGLMTRANSSAIIDRKSTRLNSSHRTISYAVF